MTAGISRTLNTTVTINGQSTLSNQPTLSVDGTNVYLTTLQSGSGFQGTEQWVIGDTAGPDGGIYSGGAPTLVANAVAPPSEDDVEVVAGDNGESYYVSAYSNGTHTITTVQGYNAATDTFGPCEYRSAGRHRSRRRRQRFYGATAGDEPVVGRGR